MVLGECEFCHQMVQVDMPADTAQELVDAEAYKYCTCDGAYRKKQIDNSIDSAEAAVSSFLSADYEDVVNTLKGLIIRWPASVRKMTLDIGKNTKLVVTCDEFGVFKVVRRDTTTRKYQSE